ncbi:porin [Pleomorphovibrio marinus]|uniref:porin n=1 Tax=Pleomorphovibrio marinus TaxID=2164132 RepID=UPI000E0BF85E|nr:porin [Pleomorphovibrio marinus]
MKTQLSFVFVLAFWSLTPSYGQVESINILNSRLDSVNGIGFIPSDSSYSINLRFRMQNRVEARAATATPFGLEERSFLTRRARLHTFGHLFNNRFRYSFQLGFTRGDQDEANSGYSNIIRDAVVFYRVNPHLELGMGVMKLPGNRQRVISSADLQFTSRTILNETFNVDRDNGFFGIYRNNLSGLRYNFIGAITTGTGRNYFIADRKTGAAYSGKLELLPFGDFTGFGDYFEGDYYREQKPKLSVAASYNYTQDAIRTGGQIGPQLFGETDMQTWLLDAVFKFRGFSLYGEYAHRVADNPITFQGDLMRNVYTGTGVNIQASYIFPSNYELASRYAAVNPGEDIDVIEGGAKEASFVLVRYFSFHRIKALAEVTYRQLNGYQFRPDLPGGMIYRFQIEFGI